MRGGYFQIGGGSLYGKRACFSDVIAYVTSGLWVASLLDQTPDAGWSQPEVLESECV